MKEMMTGVGITSLIWTATLIISISLRRKRDILSNGFLIMFIAQFINLIVCLCQHKIDGVNEYATLNWILAVLGYIGISVMTAVYHYLVISVVEENVKINSMAKYYPIVPLSICTLLYFVSYWTKWFYYLDENGVYTVTGYFMLSQLVEIIIILVDALIMIVYSIRYKKFEGLHFLAYVIFSLICVPIQVKIGDPMITYAANTISMQFMYTFILISRDKQYIEASRELVRMQSIMMVSQIQPHFIFNSLSSIMLLIKKDPISATESLGDFADYLRKNLDTISCDEPVYFTEELRHTKTYVRLEQLRFKEKLDVHYDIRAKDFKLPPLTVQPLVENAIKHGVTQKTIGGKVIISSYRDDAGAHVVIQDDGVGFDNSPVAANDRVHVGLDNVKTRLRMFGAEMIVHSEVGIGTRIELIIS